MRVNMEIQHWEIDRVLAAGGEIEMLLNCIYDSDMAAGRVI